MQQLQVYLQQFHLQQVVQVGSVPWQLVRNELMKVLLVDNLDQLSSVELLVLVHTCNLVLVVLLDLVIDKLVLMERKTGGLGRLELIVCRQFHPSVQLHVLLLLQIQQSELLLHEQPQLYQLRFLKIKIKIH